MIEVLPSILVKTPEEFESLVRRLEPYTDRVHLDIADGILVPNKTIDGYRELMEIDTRLKFDVHLMVQKPSEHLDEWLNTRADRYFVHAEADHDLKNCIYQFKNHMKEVGLVFNPETEPDTAKELVDMVDYVQFMAVHPGFYGAKFLDEVVGKISKFHSENPNYKIVVDGGITNETAPKVISAGASILISGSYVVNSPDIRKAIEELKFSSKSEAIG